MLQPVISSLSLPETASRVQQLVNDLVCLLVSFLHRISLYLNLTQASEPQLDKLSLKNTPKSDHKSPYEVELEQLEGNLRTVQLALEILTGACATLPDPSAGADDEIEDDEDEMEDDDQG